MVLRVAEEVAERVLVLLLALYAVVLPLVLHAIRNETALSIREEVFLPVLHEAEVERLFPALCDEAALSIRVEAACPCDA